MPKLDPDSIAQRLSLVLRGCRFDLSDEKRLQSQIELRLTQHNIDFEREVKLSPKDIPDFLVDGLVVECKLKKKTSKRQVFAQLERYTAHPEVLGVLLVSNIAMGLPSMIGGKPAFAISLGAGWL